MRLHYIEHDTGLDLIPNCQQLLATLAVLLATFQKNSGISYIN